MTAHYQAERDGVLVTTDPARIDFDEGAMELATREAGRSRSQDREPHLREVGGYFGSDLVAARADTGPEKGRYVGRNGTRRQISTPQLPQALMSLTTALPMNL